MHHNLFILALCAFGVACWAQQQPVFRIGNIYPTEGGQVRTSALVRDGQQMWKDTVNARGGFNINGTFYTVEIIERGITNNGEASANATMSLITEENVDLIFAPVSSFLGLTSALVANEAGVNVLLPASSSPEIYICDDKMLPPCTSPFGRRLTYATSLITPTSKFFTETLNLLQVHNAKTIAVFWEDNSFTASVADGALRAIQFIGMELVYTKVIKFSPNATLVQPDIDELITELKEIQPDVVLSGSFFSCGAFLKTARKMDFNAKAYLISNPCLILPSAVRANIGDAAKYVVSTGLLWDKRLRGEANDEKSNTTRYHHFVSNGTTPSALLFNNRFADRYGYEPGNSGMIGYSLGYITQYALETANSLDADDIQKAINAMKINGFSGEFTFDQFGENLGTNALSFQIDDDFVYQIVAPLFAITQQFVYPVPKWSERHTTYGWYKFTSERVMMALVGVAILISAGLMVWVLAYRQHKVIRAAQPLFVVLTLFGSILMYCSVFFWTLHTDDLHCNVHRWLLAVGFGLTYGALFARIYRIGQIFLEKSLEVFKVTNMMIIPIVTAVVAVEVVILTLWTAISTGRSELNEAEPFIRSDDFIACQNTTKDLIFLVILMVFNAGVLAYGIYWVIRIWKLKAILYNESKSIGFAVYTLTFFIVIIIIIQIFGAQHREIAFILRSICLILGPFISIMSLLVPRMVYMTMSDEELKRSDRSGSYTITRRTVSQLTDPGEDVKKELQKLKERNAQLESQLKEVKEGTPDKET